MTKYIYWKVLQELVDGKWEDCVWYHATNSGEMKELQQDLKDYRSDGYTVRVISRRELRNGKV